LRSRGRGRPPVGGRRSVPRRPDRSGHQLSGRRLLLRAGGRDRPVLVSHTGGLNFNPAVPIYNASQCGGLHGHIKVAPDGTVYVPNADCGGKQALVVSKDNGTTWTISKVPDSGTQDESDPSLGVGAGG